jgi:hypothetical protein
MVESPREAASAGVRNTACVGRRDETAIVYTVKGGEDDVQPVLRGCACRAKGNAFGRYLHRTGVYSGGRRTTKPQGAILSRTVNVAFFGDASGQRPVQSTRSYRGDLSGFFFLFFGTGKSTPPRRRDLREEKEEKKKPSRPPFAVGNSGQTRMGIFTLPPSNGEGPTPRPSPALSLSPTVPPSN